MNEREIAEMESRILNYPALAGRDLLRRAKELRRLSGFNEPAKTMVGYSPLYDATTGLLNGGAFGIRFSAARARATRYQKRFAVMSIDLALGRGLQDASEHDVALKLVAGRLQESVRPTDTLARIDHEKFALILEDLVQEGQPHPVTEKVLLLLGKPLRIGERQIFLDVKPNIQFYPTSMTNLGLARLTA